MTQSRLGRGLAALIPSDILESPGRPAKLAATGERGALRMVPLDQVRPNPEQPRMRFNANELESLASSISEHGVITPLLVRADEERGGYILSPPSLRLRSGEGCMGKLWGGAPSLLRCLVSRFLQLKQCQV